MSRPGAFRYASSQGWAYTARSGLGDSEEEQRHCRKFHISQTRKPTCAGTAARDGSMLLMRSTGTDSLLPKSTKTTSYMFPVTVSTYARYLEGTDIRFHYTRRIKYKHAAMTSRGKSIVLLHFIFRWCIRHGK